MSVMDRSHCPSSPPAESQGPPRWYGSLAHRGGIAEPPERLRPAPDLLTRLGGREVMERIVDRLYRRIADDPLLSPLFGGRVRGEHLGQKRFFVEWAGGEPLYRREGHGHGMYLLHYRFGIDRPLAGRWLQHLVTAMREEGLTPQQVKEVASLLGPMAHQLRHQDGPPLPAASRRLDNEQLRRLLEKEPDLFLRHRGEGRRRLFRAAEAGDAERLEILAAAGVSIHLPFLRHDLMLTPWCAARANGHGQAAEVLWRLGARSDVFSAAFLGDLEDLRALLEQRPSWVNAEDPAMDLRGITPLHHAVAGGRPGTVELLVERGALPGPDAGRRLLRPMADAGRLDAVKALLAAGAPAVDVGPGPWVKNDAVRGLLVAEGADVNLPKGAWLHFCTARFGAEDDPELVAWLLRLGADPEAQDQGVGALHLAAAAGHVGIVEALLDAGFEVDCPDALGDTPLTHVAWAVRGADRAAVAELLLDRGACLERPTCRGETVAERLRRVKGRDSSNLLAILHRYGEQSGSGSATDAP